MLQKSKYHKWEIRVKYSNFPFAFGYALLLGAYNRDNNTNLMIGLKRGIHKYVCHIFL